jgi:hypothetical protein
MTLYSSVFASLSQLKRAHAHGAKYDTRQFKFAAGKYADIVTLKAAGKLGLQCMWDEYTMRGAASCNKLAVVQFLHAKGCA